MYNNIILYKIEDGANYLHTYIVEFSQMTQVTQF